MLTYNQASNGSPRTDYSGSYHVTFKAVFYSDLATLVQGTSDELLDRLESATHRVP